MSQILVTGGTGFIGSHTIVALQEANYDVVIIDNLINSDIDVLDRITTSSGESPLFIKWDVRDKDFLSWVFAQYNFDAVIHFAGLKAVGTSCQQPFVYRENNIVGTMHLLEVMDIYDVRKLVFSSSATVYDISREQAPFAEDMHTGHTTNPYGTTKYVIEQLLQDMAIWKNMQIISLRYFNPIGAHPSGQLGENPSDEPTNLFPILMQIVEGKREKLVVYGDDYATKDGTCMRDYIHVMDLAEAHLVALDVMMTTTTNTYDVYNVGTGNGTSVLEMITLVRDVLNVNLPYCVWSRRDGDVAVSIADVAKIKTWLGRESKFSITDAIEHGWKFRQIFDK